MTPSLSLAFRLTFPDLYSRTGLIRLDGVFSERLANDAPDLFNRLMEARANPDSLAAKNESALLLELAPFVETFIATLFGIEKEAKALAAEHDRLAPIFACKRLFVQRYAVKKCKAADAESLDGGDLRQRLETVFGEPLSEI